MKMSCHALANKIHFHVEGFTLQRALIQSEKPATGKWPFSVVPVQDYSVCIGLSLYQINFSKGVARFSSLPKVALKVVCSPRRSF